MHLSSDTIGFLSDIEKNNNREWFNTHKERFQEAYSEFRSLASSIQEKFSEIDGHVDVKVFRIYRDVRFSKNKDPYKTNFAAGFTREGKYRRGGLYIQVEPQNTMIGGGFWNPNSQDLKKIREGIVRNEKEYRTLLSSSEISNYFMGIEGEELKSAPRGYAKDHSAIDLIRKKQFILSKTFTNKDVTRSGFSDTVIDGYKKLLPYFDFMSEILVYDANGEEY